jgi:predicted thioredoxin/glutaredoxin
MSTFIVQKGAIFELTKLKNLDPEMPKTLSSVLTRVVDAKTEYDVRLLAQQLGTNYRSLMYWLRGDRHVPAYLLPRICTLLGNYEALDMLESQAGRVAFKIPDPKQTSDEEFKAISALIKDVGEALESIANTLADGIVEENELSVTVPKLEAVIQECASLKYWLENLYQRRKKRKK